MPEDRSFMVPHHPTVSPAATADREQAAQVFQRAAALHRSGRLDEAIAGYRRAVRLWPAYAGALCNLGIALKQAARVNDAIAAYRRAIEIAPDYADAYFNLGIVLGAVRRHGDAAAAYRRVTEIRPNFAPAHVSLGNALKYAGRLEEALDAFRAALELKNDHVDALVNIGTVLNELGRHAEAEEACRKVLAVQAGSLPALCQQAAALTAMGRYDDAAAAARRALAIKADDIEALGALGAALKALGRGEEVVQAYRAALRASPGLGLAHCHLAEFFLEREDPAAALGECDACLAANPGHIRALSIKGVALAETGARDEARALTDCSRLMLTKVWREAPGFPSIAAFNRALAEHILSHPSLVYEPKLRATRLGRHSGELLVEPKGPIGALERMICAAVADYDATVPPDPEHPFLARPPKRWTLTIWAVVLEKQGFQVPHIHPSGWLSGVYYVSLPSVLDDPGAEQAGWIEFGRPLPRYPVKAPPELTTIRPEPGMMLVFPSYFFHRTLPFQSEETRISIAFDVMPFEPDRAGR